MVLIHIASASSGNRSHHSERSGRLIMNAAMVARIPVASAAPMGREGDQLLILQVLTGQHAHGVRRFGECPSAPRRRPGATVRVGDC
jgi:hypothetical protein